MISEGDTVVGNKIIISNYSSSSSNAEGSGAFPLNFYIVSWDDLFHLLKEYSLKIYLQFFY